MGGLLNEVDQAWDGRRHCILAFSFLSVYILSFLFEGQILYGLLALHGCHPPLIQL